MPLRVQLQVNLMTDAAHNDSNQNHDDVIEIFEPFLSPLDDFATFPRLDSAMVTAQSNAEGVIVNSSVWGGL